MRTEDESLARRARRAVDLTQTRFAALLGVERSTVQRWESGRIRPSPHALRLLRLVESEPDRVAELFQPEQIGEPVRGASSPASRRVANPELPEVDSREWLMYWHVKKLVNRHRDPVSLSIFKHTMKLVFREEERLTLLLALEARKVVALLCVDDPWVKAREDWQNEMDRNAGLVHPERGPICAVRVLA